MIDSVVLYLASSARMNVVAGIFVCFTLLVLIADVVNPVKIS